jgi:hypothetical protein
MRQINKINKEKIKWQTGNQQDQVPSLEDTPAYDKNATTPTIVNIPTWVVEALLAIGIIVGISVIMS